MSREDPQFKLRLPAELKTRIDEMAAANHRSINAEIIARLESTFLEGQSSSHESVGGPTDDPDPPVVRRVIKRNGQVFEYSDDQITTAIMRAFESLNNNPAARGGGGPKPRKKYPRE
jgi:hypothetical protein